MYTYTVAAPVLCTLREEQDKVREIIGSVNEHVLSILKSCSEENREVVFDLRAFFVKTMTEKFAIPDNGSEDLIDYLFKYRNKEVETEDDKLGVRQRVALKVLEARLSEIKTEKAALRLGYTLSEQRELTKEQVIAVAKDHVLSPAVIDGYSTGVSAIRRIAALSSTREAMELGMYLRSCVDALPRETVVELSQNSGWQKEILEGYGL